MAVAVVVVVAVVVAVAVAVSDGQVGNGGGSGIIGHGLVLLLSITKWHDLLNSPLLVYAGDRQASLDLLNLLPEETDLDPDTWLKHHGLMLAFLSRIANASNIQPDMFLLGINTYLQDPTNLGYEQVSPQCTHRT